MNPFLTPPYFLQGGAFFFLGVLHPWVQNPFKSIFPAPFGAGVGGEGCLGTTSITLENAIGGI